MRLIHGNIVILISFISIVVSYGQEPLFTEIPGWKLTQDEVVCDANNLWISIDGAADLHLEYAFVDLQTARYINPDSIEVKV